MLTQVFPTPEGVTVLECPAWEEAMLDTGKSLSTNKLKTGNTSMSSLMTHPPNPIALMNRPVTQRMI